MSAEAGRDPEDVDPDGDPQMLYPPERQHEKPSQAEGEDDPEETGQA